MWQDFWHEIESWIETVWGSKPNFRRMRRVNLLYSPQDPYYAQISESLQRLQQHWTPEQIGQYAAEMVFNPVAWQREYHFQYNTQEQGLFRYVSHCMFTILTTCLVEFPVPDLYPRLEKRLRQSERENNLTDCC
jgi:hypothetical protein